jgi:hypothetical protein
MTTRLDIKVYLVAFAFILGIAFPAQATDYVFTGIDFPDSTSSHASDINNFGNITGVYTAATGTHGYYLTGTVGGTFTTIDIPEATLTFVYGINNLGNIVGHYQDTAEKVHGFYLPVVGENSFTTIDNPGASNTTAAAINDNGNIVGFSNAGSFYLTGVGGSFTPITYPSALATNALGINNTGNVTGWYIDTSLVQHGFYLTAAINGSFTEIDYPGSVATQVFRINNSGNIVGNYTDTSGLIHGFYLTGVGGSFTTIDFPGATSTYAEGINDSGVIVGRYVDTSGVTHGFVAAPLSTNAIRTPFSQTIFDACVGESITFDGFVHTLVKVGSNKITTVTNYQGMRGVGLTSGKLYEMQCASVTNVFLSDGTITSASVFDAVVNCMLAANTSGTMMREHLTFTPDGTAVVDYSVDSTFCSP